RHEPASIGEHVVPPTVEEVVGRNRWRVLHRRSWHNLERRGSREIDVHVDARLSRPWHASESNDHQSTDDYFSQHRRPSLILRVKEPSHRVRPTIDAAESFTRQASLFRNERIPRANSWGPRP